MRKFGPALYLAAGGVASATLLLAACQNYGQPKTTASAAEAIPDKVDYNWDVRPILSQNCFQCHGNDPKNRKAGLRLDDPKAATGVLPENPGHRAIVPGNPKRSELFKRISSTDVDFRMPPREAHKTVSARDIAILERWIKQGAKYKDHWAYLPAKEVKPGRTEWDKQAVNQVDRYIFAKLKTAGLSPSPEADRETLINRVTMDLTGLPPTLAEVDAFAADTRPDAYERLVDRLLNSRAYAERQTNVWMDVARYADTGGGLNDNETGFQFPYRDWLITAFQRNIPYDRFVTWQLAGDQLPNATREQILATAFIRAGKKNTEGGAIDEDFRMEYVEERAELVGKAFLGLTVGCAKCHDHKYDIISQADYYSLGGFFNQIDQNGRGAGPTLAMPTPTQAKSLAAAQKVTQAKWTGYQATLAAAKTRVAARIDQTPASGRLGVIKASIDADTQAYYPFDSGYQASIEPMMVDAQPLGDGVPRDGTVETSGKTRAQIQAEIKVGILAARAQVDALKAAGKPVPANLTKIVDPQPTQQRRIVAKTPAKTSGKPDLSKGAVIKASGGGNGATAGALAALAAAKPRTDPDLPRLASAEVQRALDQLVANGYLDTRLGTASRIYSRRMKTGLKPEQFQWTASGLPGGAPGGLNNVKFVPGAKGQGVLLHDSVVFADEQVGAFERFQPFTLDFYVKLRAKPYEDVTRPNAGVDASILYNTSGLDSPGYELTLSDNKLQFSLTNAAPYNMVKIATAKDLPRGRWVHVTATYDGNSKAAGTHLYLDGQPAETRVLRDRLSRSTASRGFTNLTGGYFGLQFGTNFDRPELLDSAVDELRVMTRALTPAEVAYLHSPQAVARLSPEQVRAQLIEVAASKDPAVAAAWKALTDARAAQQRVETPIRQLMVAADAPVARKTYILNTGIYNSFKGEVPSQALPRVFKWDDDKPRNRLGLAQWLFDPKHPLTARIYVNRMWQNHFGSGIVQTVEDFGTQGANPTHPELLDYLAIEFIRSGWDIRHMHKLMVMSATYRQSSAITPDRLEKDPRNFLLARGPRYRMSAEQLRDNALFASGLLVDKVGGDSVFPMQPEGIWDGTAQGFVTYPFDVPADQTHRRSMYTFTKRNAPTANMVVFDQPDRNLSTVARTISNTPLQSLVLLNDPQFVEAYRKLAERVIKTRATGDEQLVTLFRLGARRHPSARELDTLRRYRAKELATAAKSPEEVDKLLRIGVARNDPSVDRAQLAALTVLAAGIMNSPDAYTLR